MAHIGLVLDQRAGDSWTAVNADCIPFTASLPSNSIDLSVYSPPFSSLYIYGESEADMGNSSNDDEFFEHYRYLVREKLRVTRPGRLTAIHVKDLVYYQGSSERGTSGIRRFSDRCADIHEAEGWDFQCRITIRRCPVLERSKTNAHGLLWKTFKADASFCRVGMPEYLMVFRKWAREGEEHLVRPVVHPPEGKYATVKPWQVLASPVWNCSDDDDQLGDYDLPATDVLNVKVARDDRDEKHLCPMPLNITERAIELWTNAGDVVYSPFMGIGSEGYKALQMRRKFIGVELKPAYWRQAVRNLEEAERSASVGDLFTGAAA